MNAVAMRTATNLNSMLPPTEREMSFAACERSGGASLGDLERIAIDRGDVEDLAGLTGRFARDLRIPLRVPVLHAGVARAPVDPGLEGGRLADVQAAHGLRHELVAVAMHPQRAYDRENRRDDGLGEMAGAEVGDRRADEGGSAVAYFGAGHLAQTIEVG